MFLYVLTHHNDIRRHCLCLDWRTISVRLSRQFELVRIWILKQKRRSLLDIARARIYSTDSREGGRSKISTRLHCVKNKFETRYGWFNYAMKSVLPCHSAWTAELVYPNSRSQCARRSSAENSSLFLWGVCYCWSWPERRGYKNTGWSSLAGARYQNLATAELWQWVTTSIPNSVGSRCRVLLKQTPGKAFKNWAHWEVS